MHKPGVVVSDVDGVLLDFYSGAARVLEDMLQRPMVKVDDRPATRFRYGLTMEEYQRMRMVMRDHPHGWANLPTLPGAVAAIRALNEAGHEVVFLSSCGQSLNDLRRENLDRLGLAHCKLICVEDGDKNAKGAVLDRLKPVAFIDDHMKMLVQAQNVPNRVWIDHGCSLEVDAEGRSYLDQVSVFRTPSLRAWARAWLPAAEPAPEPRRALAFA